MAIEKVDHREGTLLDEESRPADEALRRDGGPARSNRRAVVFVWGSWVVSLVSTLVVVMQGARNLPTQEDWQMVPAMTGHQEHFWSWLWTRNNEHLVPLPKLAYLGLLKLWPDFRVGMVFNIALMALIAGAFIVFMRHDRGYIRWTDAFFPIAFLHLGHWENLAWGWQVQFVLATALAAAVLLLAAPGRRQRSRGSPGESGQLSTPRAIALGACLVAIPLTGATALPFAPLVALALIPQVRRVDRGPRAILVCSIVLTLAVTAVYLVGLKEPAAFTPSPSVWASIETGAKVLALSIGPAAGAWWFLSAVAVLSVLAGAAFVLYRANPARTLTLLAFLAGGVVMAAFIGESRAGSVSRYGVPDRYALIGVPVLSCAYLAYDRYAGSTWRRLGPGILCVSIIALLPLNIAFGLQYRDWYDHNLDTFAGDIKAGVPADELTWDGPFVASADPMMRASMTYLRQARLGVFSQLTEHQGVVAPGQEIDGFGTGGGGWLAEAGRVSVAVPARSGGRPVLRWDYEPAGDAAASLTRPFPTPQDWRGQGAIALTVNGEGSGRRIDVEVTAASGAGGVDRFGSFFVDDQAGTRIVVLPWNAFLYVDHQGQTQWWVKPMPQQGILGVAFSTTAPRRGTLVVSRVALEPGHGEFGWPMHPAADRRSLPPWR